MSSIFSADFQDFIRALNDSNTEYMLLGGYAVILYGYDRTTGDMDVWVNRTSVNYQRLRVAFSQFGMPMFDMTEARFLDLNQADVFSFGVPPSAIDLLTQAKGVDFDDCFARSTRVDHKGLNLRLIAREDLLRAKAAVGRMRDLDDIQKLTD